MVFFFFTLKISSYTHLDYYLKPKKKKKMRIKCSHLKTREYEKVEIKMWM